MKRSKLLFVLFVALIMSIGLVSAQPIEISTCQELQDMQNNLTADYILTSDIDCSDTVNWNNGYGFIPISYDYNDYERFTGVLDGQGHTISNLYQMINDTHPSHDVGGLFGGLEGAVVKNLKLENINFTNLERFMYGYIGGLSTAAYHVVVDNVSVTGSIGGLYYIGGIFSYMAGNTNISNTYTDLDVYFYEDLEYNYAYTVFGGIATNLVGSMDEGNIINSYAVSRINCIGCELGIDILTEEIHGILHPRFAPGNVNIVNSFFDKDVNNWTDNETNGRTTAEMQNISTFSAWDIAEFEVYDDETWFILNGEDYPKLWFEFDDYEVVLPGLDLGIEGYIYHLSSTDFFIRDSRDTSNIIYETTINYPATNHFLNAYAVDIDRNTIAFLGHEDFQQIQFFSIYDLTTKEYLFSSTNYGNAVILGYANNRFFANRRGTSVIDIYNSTNADYIKTVDLSNTNDFIFYEDLAFICGGGLHIYNYTDETLIYSNTSVGCNTFNLKYPYIVGKTISEIFVYNLETENFDYVTHTSLESGGFVELDNTYFYYTRGSNNNRQVFKRYLNNLSIAGSSITSGTNFGGSGLLVGDLLISNNKEALNVTSMEFTNISTSNFLPNINTVQGSFFIPICNYVDDYPCIAEDFELNIDTNKLNVTFSPINGVTNSRDIIHGDRFVFVRPSSPANVPATIQFKEVTQPEEATLLKDGEECGGDCLNVTLGADTITFDVLGWSNYSYEIFGCTDEWALNFDENATLDDDSCEYNSFVTEWVISDSTPLNINLNSAQSNFRVDWGDGSGYEYNVTSHVYSTPGNYNVTIDGRVEEYGFDYYSLHHRGCSNNRLLHVHLWGNLTLINGPNVFRSCTLLQTISNTTSPDLSQTTSLSGLFTDTSFTGTVDHWDVSNVEYFDAMFYSSSFANSNNLEYDLSNWNMSSAISISNMFSCLSNCGSSNYGNISNWDVSNVENFNGLLRGTREIFIGQLDLSLWNVSSATDLRIRLYSTANFNPSPYSTEKYSKIITTWVNNLDLNENVLFELQAAPIVRFNRTAYFERLYLIEELNWTIIDGGFDDIGGCSQDPSALNYNPEAFQPFDNVSHCQYESIPISTCQELQGIQPVVDEYEIIDRNKHYTLVKNVECKNTQISGFIAIDDFRGTIEGDGYSILNFYSESYVINQKHGLIVDFYGTIRNLGSFNFNIKGIGDMSPFVVNNYGSLENLYSIGEITFVSPGYTAGGIAARSQGNISDSYSRNLINVPGFNIASNTVGGLVGLTYPSTLIENSYTVTEYNRVSPSLWLFVNGASPEGTFINNFCDVSHSNRCSGSQAKSTEEMQNISTFSDAGWDIADVDSHTTQMWGINDNESYPVLYYQVVAPSNVTLNPPVQFWTNENITVIYNATFNTIYFKYCVTENGTQCVPEFTSDGTLLSEEGEYTICVSAFNELGMESDVYCSDSDAYQIDFTMPNTQGNITFGLEGNNNWYVSNITFELNATDNLSGVLITYYCVDGNNTCTPNLTYTDPINIEEDGQYYIRFNSLDNALNNESINAINIKVDTTNPNTTINLFGRVGTNQWYRSNVTLNLTSQDDTSGLEALYYCIDTQNICDPTNTIENLTATLNILFEIQGTNYLRYYTQDFAGNQENLTSLEIKIDYTDPITTETVIGGVMGENQWFVEEILVQLEAEDNISGLKNILYCVDVVNACRPGNIYNEPILINNDGTNYLRYYSIDNAGNVEVLSTYVGS